MEVIGSVTGTEGLRLEHGLAVVTAERAGRSIAGEVIAFQDAALSQHGRTTVFETDHAASIRFALYGNEVLANGWQPCDQPSPAAYLPMRYAALDRYSTADGAILIEREPVRRQVWRELVADPPHFGYQLCAEWLEARASLEDLARRNGFTDVEARELADRIQARLREIARM